MITVSLSSSQPLTTLGLQQLFSSAEGFALVEPVTDRAAGRIERTDVVVHVGADQASDLPAVMELAAAYPVLVIGEGNGVSGADRYLNAGALGYLHFSAALTTVLEAVKRVAQRHRILYLQPSLSAAHDAAGDGVALSARERQVLEHIALGRTHDQTARSLGLSRHTVDTYVKRARRKLSAGNKADLVRAALNL
jgi:two-component system invasion response regulator UvrY